MRSNGYSPELPAERLIAILKYRGMEAEAMMVAQRRNLQALVEASDVVAKGMQEISARQADMLRQSINRASAAMPELGKPSTLRDMTLQQIDFAQSSVTAVLDNLQEISALAWRCNREVFDTINRSVLDGLQSVLKALPGGAGEDGGGR